MDNEVDKKDTKSVVEEPPTGPAVVISTKRAKSSKMRSMSISLDGLLDYVEEDREECTFELSLFAELFQEMLQRKFGTAIYNSLVALREGLRYKRTEERKRTRDRRDDGQPGGGRKKTKFDIEPMDEVKADGKTDKTGKAEKDDKTENSGKADENLEDVGTQENGSVGAENAKETDKIKDTDVEMSDTAMDLQKEEEKKKDKKKESELPPKVETRHVVDYELQKAYYYFDRNRVGYLKLDDLRRLLHALGLFLSHRNIKDLVSYAITESSKSRDDRIIDRAFTDKDEPVEAKKGA